MDQFPLENIEDAISICEANGISYCISNPCFEVWYLLHFGFSTRRFSSLQEVEPELTRPLGEKYDKREDYIDRLFPKIDDARRNYKTLDIHHRNRCRYKLEGNPSTDMGKIIGMFRFDQ